MVLYKYGGVYLDMDSSIAKPLRELIKNDDQAIISSENNPERILLQWCLIFSKQHPILKKTIELIVENIKNNSYPNDILRMTGPRVFTKAVMEFHKESFNNKILDRLKIDRSTDITYKRDDNISYRLYGIDYNRDFSFKHNHSFLLYINRKSWGQELKEKPLLI